MEKEFHWRLRLALIAAGAGTFALFLALRAVPSLVETVYGDFVGPLLASSLSAITGVLPFSLIELLVIGLVLWQVWCVARGLGEVRRGERGWASTLAGGTLRLLADVGVVMALFYVLWGFNYARPPLEQRLQWNGREADIEEVARLAEEMVEAANFEYTTLTLTEDLGEPSRAPQRGELLPQLDEGWRSAGDVLGAPAAAIFGYGRPKVLLSSFLLDYTQTSGFYSPWTGEANYNGGTPDVSLPQVIAHEMSHQRGFAREDEANFAGYLVAASAPESYARYSAYVFAQRQLLSTLARYDRDRATAL
ncbi:MAG: DUF3810 domain-containing protein, partial [Acidobacteriota bacterium]